MAICWTLRSRRLGEIGGRDLEVEGLRGSKENGKAKKERSVELNYWRNFR